MREMTRAELLRVDGVKPWGYTTGRAAALGSSPSGDLLRKVEIPQLEPLPPYHTKNVTLHILVAPMFQRAFELIEQLGLLDRVLSYDGAYANRAVRGSTTTMSSHAFGAAMDINAAWNGLGHTPPGIGEKGSVRELIGVFESCGLAWGGWWNRPDGMHFEPYKIVKKDDLPVLKTDADPGDERRGDDVSTWAQDAVRLATEVGLVKGSGDGFVAPQQALTREQGIVLLMRLWSVLESGKVLTDDQRAHLLALTGVS